jgi:hypothetical protein
MTRSGFILSELIILLLQEVKLTIPEPTLMVLLQYARVAGVHLEEIVDDRLELPAKMPGPVNYKSVKPRSRPKG